MKKDFQISFNNILIIIKIIKITRIILKKINLFYNFKNIYKLICIIIKNFIINFFIKIEKKIMFNLNNRFCFKN